jgi:hypothetical protein
MNDACRGERRFSPGLSACCTPSEWVCIPQFTVSYLELAYDWHFHDIKSLHTFKLSRVWQGNLTSRPQGAQLPTDFPHVIPLRLLTIQWLNSGFCVQIIPEVLVYNIVFIKWDRQTSSSLLGPKNLHILNFSLHFVRSTDPPVLQTPSYLGWHPFWCVDLGGRNPMARFEASILQMTFPIHIHPPRLFIPFVELTTSAGVQHRDNCHSLN